MFEKVSPAHPDKMCDRLAGAIVDLAYSKEKNPRIAVEVLAGHGKVFIIIETSLSREQLSCAEIDPIVWRIFGNDVEINVTIVPQDPILAHNQDNGMRVADNGIFRGVPPTHEQKLLTAIAASIYDRHPFDGKYIISNVFDKEKFDEMTSKIAPLQQRLRDLNSYAGQMLDIVKSENRQLNKDEQKKWDAYDKEFDKVRDELRERLNEREKQMYRTQVTICQSHLSRGQEPELREHLKNAYGIHLPIINPLGEWTGGPNTDSGATNRKLGSDMGDGVTGGGLHGKDLSKADVSVNIWCYLESIRTGHEVTASCSIGDETVNGIPYKDIVEQARLYIHTIGGFEKFAEWGLVRPGAQV